MAATSSAAFDPKLHLQAQTRWHPIEVAFWAATLLPFVLFPNHLVLASQIAITALFARKVLDWCDRHRRQPAREQIAVQ